jgi:hypothetical protein
MRNLLSVSSNTLVRYRGVTRARTIPDDLLTTGVVLLAVTSLVTEETTPPLFTATSGRYPLVLRVAQVSEGLAQGAAADVHDDEKVAVRPEVTLWLRQIRHKR